MKVSQLMCIMCGHKQISVYLEETEISQLECSNCGRVDVMRECDSAVVKE
jgi:transcription elongation factor Elf1